MPLLFAHGIKQVFPWCGSFHDQSPQKLHGRAGNSWPLDYRLEICPSTYCNTGPGINTFPHQIHTVFNFSLCNAQIFINHDKSHMSPCMTKPTKWPVHPAKSRISIFIVRMKKHWVLSYPLSAQRRLIRPGGCPGSESSLGIQVKLLVWLCTGSCVFSSHK